MKRYLVCIAEINEDSNEAISVTPALSMYLESFEEAAYLTHKAFEDIGVLNDCKHLPLPIPATLLERSLGTIVVNVARSDEVKQ